MNDSCSICDDTGIMEDPQHGHAFKCSACNAAVGKTMQQLWSEWYDKKYKVKR